MITFLVALLLSLGSSFSLGGECVPLTVGTDVQWASLLDDGWFGVQSDRMEALYAPFCGKA